MSKRPTSRSSPGKKTPAGTAARRAKKGPPRLLTGGNPQIAKGAGDAPVREYLAAMPGWKRDAGERIDALIERAVPGVCKAVKWNSPLYGVRPGEWFLGVHCLTRSVKVTFFHGAALTPMPPVGSTQKHVRSLHIAEPAPGEGVQIDEAQFVAWVRQASAGAMARL